MSQFPQQGGQPMQFPVGGQPLPNGPLFPHPNPAAQPHPMMPAPAMPLGAPEVSMDAPATPAIKYALPSFKAADWVIGRFRVCWVLDPVTGQVTDGVTTWAATEAELVVLNQLTKTVAEHFRGPWDALNRAKGSNLLNWLEIRAKAEELFAAALMAPDGAELTTRIKAGVQFLEQILSRLNDLDGYAVQGVPVLSLKRL